MSILQKISYYISNDNNEETLNLINEYLNNKENAVYDYLVLLYAETLIGLESFDKTSKVISILDVLS